MNFVTSYFELKRIKDVFDLLNILFNSIKQKAEWNYNDYQTQGDSTKLNEIVNTFMVAPGNSSSSEGVKYEGNKKLLPMDNLPLHAKEVIEFRQYIKQTEEYIDLIKLTMEKIVFFRL